MAAVDCQNLQPCFMSESKSQTPVSSSITPKYIQYSHELEKKYLPDIRALISKDLSEPYSIYVYRYFLCQWAHLCFLALNEEDETLIGVIVCKLEVHSSRSPPTRRGYIAMLAVESTYRGRGIATSLVKQAIAAMADRDADEIVLETEETNKSAIQLYERLGFIRSKKLHRYYLNGNSAYRLILLLKSVDPYGALIDAMDLQEEDSSFDML
ncbi:N-alpha-acetyltransferase 30 [Ceratocystis pirilliformis]|uniref:N-alpha-acetyltransferase 30 n=1 Tax=Ceratocystis pirilliformis TaxID=259994 RepID=A0ABR3ZJY1_9PEZI